MPFDAAELTAVHSRLILVVMLAASCQLQAVCVLVIKTLLEFFRVETFSIGIRVVVYAFSDD